VAPIEEGQNASRSREVCDQSPNRRSTMRPTLARLTALTLLMPALLAMTSSTAEMTVQPGSRLWISGTSTVRGFECKASSFDATVESIGAGAALAVVNGAKGITTVEVNVPAAKLDCGNGTMNDHMMKALKAKDAPVVGFKLDSYILAKSATGTTVEMNGVLTLGGTAKPITVTANATSETDGLRVTGRYELRMTQFGLKPPTLMLGTMKVNELVKVNFDLLLKD
jgi:polyisoprenoid-binding protein YceI